LYYFKVGKGVNSTGFLLSLVFYSSRIFKPFFTPPHQRISAGFTTKGPAKGTGLKALHCAAVGLEE